MEMKKKINFNLWKIHILPRITEEVWRMCDHLYRCNWTFIRASRSMNLRYDLTIWVRNSWATSQTFKIVQEDSCGSTQRDNKSIHRNYTWNEFYFTNKTINNWTQFKFDRFMCFSINTKIAQTIESSIIGARCATPTDSIFLFSYFLTIVDTS